MRSRKSNEIVRMEYHAIPLSLWLQFYLKCSKQVFISATNRDLRSVRTIIAEALLRIGVVPVSHDSFPAVSTSTAEMLRNTIASCDAVIYVVGICYGWVPEGPVALGRSFTQLEYDIARQLKKPI